MHDVLKSSFDSITRRVFLVKFRARCTLPVLCVRWLIVIARVPREKDDLPLSVTTVCREPNGQALASNQVSRLGLFVRKR
jgi:hypothetical protein